MNKIAKIYCTFVFALSASGAVAQDVGEYAFSLGASSVGFTGEVKYRLSEKWRLRAMLSGAPTYRKREESGDLIYDAAAEIRGLSLLADYQIGNSQFHIIGGAFLSGTKIVGQTSGTLLIGDSVYNSTIQADVRFSNRVSPILAIGFEQPIGDQWNLAASAGYMYTGGVDVGISVLSGDPVDLDDLVNEAHQIQSEVDSGYPFLTFGLTYTF
ncbi:hypothetical protein [Parasedimentitalea psychrophila]|uniref:Outer membrane protein beta-barrel domain-containing protein n=1 Tax=Parasedimentitalea psychrophila TaxID=2997337 RepID=A0A9Y2KXS5_9RHOB|nr:hypothetical protein [Parasedimentitalea psychrophila]WIY25100.1 hypothetical protein QPJ95_21855 [Parasedimentitalea psychrophila]